MAWSSVASTSPTCRTPTLARQAIETAGFVVALELRESEVTRAADVVFPVAPVTDRSGTFVNWEGRVRPFGKVLHNPSSLPDLRVLAGIAEELETPLGFRTSEQVWAEMTQVGPWDGEPPRVRPRRVATPGAHAAADGELVLASWKQLDRRRPDAGRRRRDAAYGAQAGRARRPGHARRRSVRPPATLVTLTGPLGSLDLPIGVADLAEGTVWAPASAPDASVRHRVGPAGSPVSITTIVGGDQ